MTRECPVRFCEQLRVKFPRLTHRPWYEHPIVAGQVKSRDWYKRHKLLYELSWRENKILRAIAPRRFEFEANGIIGQNLYPIVCNGWPGHVTNKLLKPVSFMGFDGSGSVDRVASHIDAGCRRNLNIILWPGADAPPIATRGSPL
jgi:hypothetical protein